jgi:hypothetical protein
VNAERFVVAAAQIGAGGRSGPVPPLDSPELWPRVVELAVEHRVAPLVSEALSRSEAAAPASIRQALLGEVLRSSATQLLCEGVLADVVRTLAGRGVEVLVLKGPTVAHTIYPRPELRIYHDLDILCRVSDYTVLREALVERGYASAGTLEVRGTHDRLAEKPSPWESHSVRGFYDPSGDVKVEVHFDVLQLGLADRQQEQFWQESRTLRIRDVDIRVLAPEHQFLQLALHAHRHCYSRLGWLLELALIIEQQRESMRWELLASVARREGVGAAVRHAIATANVVLGTPLPALPPASYEERALGAVYRVLWPFEKALHLDKHERHRLLHFLPDDADPRNVLYGLVLMGRRRDKLQALVRRRWPFHERPRLVNP